MIMLKLRMAVDWNRITLEYVCTIVMQSKIADIAQQGKFPDATSFPWPLVKPFDKWHVGNDMVS